MTDDKQDEEPQRSGVYYEGEASTDPKVIRTARLVRRIGYPIMVALILFISIPVIVGVFQGIGADEIWDPWTKVKLDTSTPNSHKLTSCHGQGVQLVAKMKTAEPPDDAAISQWTSRCAWFEPDLKEILESTR